MRASNLTTLWVICAMVTAPAFPQDPEAADTAADAGPTFAYQSGDITLPNRVATLHLGTRYRYLDAVETEKLLVAWGNEPGNETEGAIVPGDVDPMAEDGWAVILTYEDEGHVDDAEAAEIDYDDMLKDMKEGTDAGNEARKEAGFAPVHLVDWAERPHYDASAKKLYWAKELDFEGSAAHALNYDVRVLGREGVLSMNAVATIHQLPQIRAEMRPLIDVAEFNPGYRYAEYNAKTDRLAGYGLGALIAGGVAAKLGLFAKLGALLLAFKKFFIVGLVALGGLLSRFFGKKKDTTT